MDSILFEYVGPSIKLEGFWRKSCRSQYIKWESTFWYNFARVCY